MYTSLQDLQDANTYPHGPHLACKGDLNPLAALALRSQPGSMPRLLSSVMLRLDALRALICQARLQQGRDHVMCR